MTIRRLFCTNMIAIRELFVELQYLGQDHPKVGGGFAVHCQISISIDLAIKSTNCMLEAMKHIALKSGRDLICL